ncbi:GMC oxidoreductase [Pseudooceanicola marinus]|uniref:GMC oxidoreductase n=1 Tax=Pseudooceanicola marinus TaxID=396013 RepID=UPI001CD3A055|nr:GMC family oxidoreductase [Pseudooceanicola marinus]MCA1338066.1 GMC family oxidoreductase [Pseudooceanicola marinus]
MSEQKYDALIVGAGAAGAVAAQELTAQGLSVLMLESGEQKKPSDFVKSERKPKNTVNLMDRALATMTGQGVQARAMFFARQFAKFYVNDRKSPYTTPKDAPFLWVRGNQEGGRTHVFGRVLFRWSDDDFKPASRAGLGLDWPISYADMAPYYDEVEEVLGLHGNADGLTATPDSKVIAPVPLTEAEKTFKADVEAAHLKKPVIPWRILPPRSDRMLAPLAAAKATGKLTVRYNAIARRVLTEGDRATGVEIIDRETRAVLSYHADTVVLAASPIETVRLMLNSKSDTQPQGLGNNAGQLGRYFMDQVPVIGQGDYPRAKGQQTFPDFDDYYGSIGGFFIMRDEVPMTERLEFASQGSVGRADTATPDAPARISFFCFGSMLPHADNRITLDPKKKDAWGIPAPHIRCKMHEYEELLARRTEDSMIALMEEQGAQLEFVGSPLGLRELGRGPFPDADWLSRTMFRKFFHKSMTIGAAIHEAGGAVMGNDPARSVLNEWGQVWDVPNVVVSDASAFASCGVTGTTLTVMAHSLRVARHAAEELKATTDQAA